MESFRNIVVLLVAAFIILAIVFVAYLSDMFTQVGLGVLVLSTGLTAVGSIATYMQAVEARRQREDAERPEVSVYFQPVNRMIYCIVQNFGVLPAKNIRIQFNPSPVIFDSDRTDKKLADISLFVKPILYLPPNERYWKHIGAGYQVLSSNQPPIEITVQYESTSGKKYKEITVVDLMVLAQANDPEPTLSHQLTQVINNLERIAKALEPKLADRNSHN